MHRRLIGPFVPRYPELLALEGKYGDVVISCRHRDILRCSITKHFRSCFNPNGAYSEQPRIYCYHPEVCIIGIKNRAGDWQSRAFAFYDKTNKTLNVARIYGDGLNYNLIVNIIKGLSGSLAYEIKVRETYGDIYFMAHD